MKYRSPPGGTRDLNVTYLKTSTHLDNLSKDLADLRDRDATLISHSADMVTQECFNYHILPLPLVKNIF